MRLFSLCEQMKWSHLPVTGGLYDQHPQLLEEWQIIFQKRGEFQERERKADEAKNRAQMGRRGKRR